MQPLSPLLSFPPNALPNSPVFCTYCLSFILQSHINHISLPRNPVGLPLIPHKTKFGIEIGKVTVKTVQCPSFQKPPCELLVTGRFSPTDNDPCGFLRRPAGFLDTVLVRKLRSGLGPGRCPWVFRLVPRHVTTHLECQRNDRL